MKLKHQNNSGIRNIEQHNLNTKKENNLNLNVHHL